MTKYWGPCELEFGSWPGHRQDHHEDVNYKGHTHHASRDDPQYETKSDKTDHVAAHKEGALKKID